MAEWRLGSYQLQRKLGEGGMAQVYLARDVRLGRDVAVKVLDRKLADRPGFRERFMREARLAASLDHPNIVPLYDFGDEDALFLVMPFLSGGSLQDLLPRAPLQAGEVVTYGSQIADALDYAHQRKVVHRDVKPANMLFHSDGRLMLSDFGLAKIVSQTNTPNAPRNRPDAGTPEYMAPEQVVGSSDARSDIYGLGVVLYPLLTGRLPFGGSSSHEVMQERLRSELVPPSHYNPAIPPAMEAVVLRAMARRPDDRFQRASELGAALLGALIAGHDAGARSITSSPSHGGSRPTGPAAFIPPGDIPGPVPQPWLPSNAGPSQISAPTRGQASAPTHGQTPAPTHGQTPAPQPGSWAEHGPSSSIVGLLPDLNMPFTGYDIPDQPGAPESPLSSGAGARSGNWGSFAGSNTTGGGPALNRRLASGRQDGRAPSSPISQLQRQPVFSHPQPAPPPRVRATMAPTASQSLAPVVGDPRIALPGSHITDPPSAPTPQERSSRLWVVIAILLILLLFAAIALLRYFEIAQTSSIH